MMQLTEVLSLAEVLLFRLRHNSNDAIGKRQECG